MNPFKRGADPYADAEATRNLAQPLINVPMTAAELAAETGKNFIVPITGYLRRINVAVDTSVTVDSGATQVLLGVYRSSTLLKSVDLTGLTAGQGLATRITDEDIPVTEGEVLSVKAPFGATAGLINIWVGVDPGALLT